MTAKEYSLMAGSKMAKIYEQEMDSFCSEFEEYVEMIDYLKNLNHDYKS